MRKARSPKLLIAMGIALMVTSPGDCFEIRQEVMTQIAKNRNGSVSLSQLFDQLELGMKFEEFIKVAGKPIATIPLARKVVRWRKKDYEVNLITKDGAIESKGFFGSFKQSVSDLESYEEIVRVLGPPDQKGEASEFTWTDEDGCNMSAVFVKEQAIEIGISLPIWQVWH
ncbi:MAG: hypothetical protein ACKOOC_10420 [Cyanobium sp.]